MLSQRFAEIIGSGTVLLLVSGPATESQKDVRRIAPVPKRRIMLVGIRIRNPYISQYSANVLPEDGRKDH